MNGTVSLVEEAKVGGIDGSRWVDAGRGELEVLDFIRDKSSVGLAQPADRVGVSTGFFHNLVGPTLAVRQLSDAAGGGFALNGDAYEDDVANLEKLLVAGEVGAFAVISTAVLCKPDQNLRGEDRMGLAETQVVVDAC